MESFSRNNTRTQCRAFRRSDIDLWFQMPLHEQVLLHGRHFAVQPMLPDMLNYGSFFHFDLSIGFALATAKTKWRKYEQFSNWCKGIN
jgi:hypothetical protein